MSDLDLDRAVLLVGDCRARLAQLPDNSVDSVVTDPPYELGFMGRQWDASGIAYSLDLWRAVLRVLKPGGHMLAFGGTRTYHRMTCAIEDAGFEVRDSLHWMYGTGFPKSLDVSKAIDAAAGETQPVVVAGASGKGAASVNALGKGLNVGFAERPRTAPVTAAAAAAWHGWGTALKPAHEPIVLARKPLTGTVAANVQQWGTGALNIDGTRIGTSKTVPSSPRRAAQGAAYNDLSHATGETSGFDANVGRWPANVLLDEHAAAELDAQSGTLKSGALLPGHKRGSGVTSYDGGGGVVRGTYGGDSGGASRFFYVAKPSRAERDFGCEHLPAKTGGEATDREDGSAGTENPRAGAGRTGGARNYHPTVKPVQLMRYLVRLITPPNGIVLDPFAGSGTTGIAALREGFRFLGCEASEEYAVICAARITKAHEEGRQAA